MEDAATKAEAEAQPWRLAEAGDAKRQAEEIEPQRGRVPALEAQRTQRDPIPGDLPVDVQILRAVEANPLFANAPPVALKTYHLAMTSSIEGGRGRTMSASETRVRPVRPGLSRVDTSKSFSVNGRTIRGTSSGLVAGNGLVEVAGKASGGITRLTALTANGRIFPVETGNRFSIAASYQVQLDGSMGDGTPVGPPQVMHCLKEI